MTGDGHGTDRALHRAPWPLRVRRWGDFPIVVLYLLPLAHPLAVPLGVPSHLLWFVHVLPVAILTWEHGRWGGVAAIGASSGLVVLGDRLLGMGFIRGAPWESALSLGVSLTFANLLVASFALYARGAASQYETLFDGSDTATVRVDGDGRIITMNRAAKALLRRTAVPGAAGGHIQDVLNVQALGDLERLEKRGGWTGPVNLDKGDGQGTVHLLATAVRSGPPGDPGYHVFLADRTTEVAQAIDMERIGQLATLGETLAVVAHDLKNSLTAIAGFAEMGLAEPLSPVETREVFQLIRDQAQRMRDYSGDLLGYARPRSEDEPTLIHDVVPRIARVLAIALRNRDVNLVTRVEGEGVVAARAGTIERILQNLVFNAADAAQGPATITVSVYASDNAVVVEVTDDGPGFPEGFEDRAFDPHVTTRAGNGGNGLGLAISRRLARSMGGDLTARNLAPRGAALTLTLPPEPPGSRPFRSRPS